MAQQLDMEGQQFGNDLGAVRRAGLLAGLIVSILWVLMALFLGGEAILALIWVVVGGFLSWLTAWLMTRTRRQ